MISIVCQGRKIEHKMFVINLLGLADFAGTSRQFCGDTPTKSSFPQVWRDIPNLLISTPSRGRGPTERCPDLRACLCGLFLLPDPCFGPLAFGASDAGQALDKIILDQIAHAHVPQRRKEGFGPPLLLS